MALTILYSVKHTAKLKKDVAKRIQYIIDYNADKYNTLDKIHFNPSPLELAGKKNWSMSGSTALPDNSDAAWEDIKINVAVLTLCRRTIPDAQWHVDVDGHEIQWVEKDNAYDPYL